MKILFIIIFQCTLLPMVFGQLVYQFPGGNPFPTIPSSQLTGGTFSGTGWWSGWGSTPIGVPSDGIFGAHPLPNTPSTSFATFQTMIAPTAACSSCVVTGVGFDARHDSSTPVTWTLFSSLTGPTPLASAIIPTGSSFTYFWEFVSLPLPVGATMYLSFSQAVTSFSPTTVIIDNLAFYSMNTIPEPGVCGVLILAGILIYCQRRIFRKKRT